MAAKTLTPPQVNALRTGTGRPNTLASLVRLELMDDAHQLTRAGRNIRNLIAIEGDDTVSLSHVADVVREIAGVNWTLPQTFWINEAGARTIAEGVPLFHNGSAVSVVWHPSTQDAYVYAGTDVVQFRHGVRDLSMVEAAEWARTAVASAPVVVPVADWERELMESGTVAPERPAVDVTYILPQDLRPGMAIMDGFDPDMIVVSVAPTGAVEEDGTAETLLTYTRDGRVRSGKWLNDPSWCRMPVRTTSIPATPAAPVEDTPARVTNEGTPVINVFVDDANGRNVTCLALPRATAVPMMDYLDDAGYRLSHDGWFTAEEERAQRDAAAEPESHGHTLVYDVETEARGVYYRCDGCGSVGPRRSFTFPCATDV